MHNDVGAFFGAILFIALYVAPSIIGWLRHVRDIGPVLVINILLGWTIIGWIISLAMALRTATVAPTSPVQFGGRDDGQEPEKEKVQ